MMYYYLTLADETEVVFLTNDASAKNYFNLSF